MSGLRPLLLVALLTLPSFIRAEGGVPTTSRARVQHATDPDVGKIRLTPTSVTVQELLRQRNLAGKRMDFTKYHDRRLAPFETTLYRIEGTMESIRIDKEGDIRFVVEGASGSKAVIEIPELEEAKGSPLLRRMQRTRKALVDRFHPTATDRKPNVWVRVDGIGFLGSRRRSGAHPFGENVRLMPAVDVHFSKR